MWYRHGLRKPSKLLQSFSQRFDMVKIFGQTSPRSKFCEGCDTKYWPQSQATRQISTTSTDMSNSSHFFKTYLFMEIKYTLPYRSDIPKFSCNYLRTRVLFGFSIKQDILVQICCFLPMQVPDQLQVSLSV